MSDEMIPGVQRTAQLHVYGFRTPKYRPRPWLRLRVVAAAYSLKDARKILAREGFDRPKQSYQVDDTEAASLAIQNAGCLVWQSLDDWGTNDQSWQVGGRDAIEAVFGN